MSDSNKTLKGSILLGNQIITFLPQQIQFYVPLCNFAVMFDKIGEISICLGSFSEHFYVSSLILSLMLQVINSIFIVGQIIIDYLFEHKRESTKMYFLQLYIYTLTKIKNQTMNQNIHNQERDISSSEDHCRCQACKNQEEFKNNQRQNNTNIHMYKHLKKRGVPPVKKEVINKELSHKAKYTTKKEEIQKRSEPEKSPATPLKHRLIEVLRSKQALSNSFFIDYHPVSHSQRQKFPNRDGTAYIAEQPRRIMNMEDLKFNAFNKDSKVKIESLKLVQISENPQNIRLRYHNSRSVSQASASCKEQHEQQFKSLQKLKE